MLHGISCRSCDGQRKAQAYVTAYDIAVKNGFRGTEEEWIESLQTVYQVRVLTAEDGEWTCRETLAQILTLTELKEVHLVTKEGRTAFTAGISQESISFRTPSYETDEGTVYELYTLTADGGTYEAVNVDEHDAGTISKAMLSAEVQGLLDGSLQASAQAQKSMWQTHAVGVDENGELWTIVPTDYIPESVQPVKTEEMTCEVGKDGSGRLWSAGYQKPEGGIPAADMSQVVQDRLALATTALQPGDVASLTVPVDQINAGNAAVFLAYINAATDQNMPVFARNETDGTRGLLSSCSASEAVLYTLDWTDLTIYDLRSDGISARKVALQTNVTLVVEKTGSSPDVYDVTDATELEPYGDIATALSAGADVRIKVARGAGYYSAWHPLDSWKSGIYVFAGPEYDYYGGVTTTVMAYYVLDVHQQHVERIERALT